MRESDYPQLPRFAEEPPDELADLDIEAQENLVGLFAILLDAERSRAQQHNEHERCVNLSPRHAHDFLRRYEGDHPSESF